MENAMNATQWMKTITVAAALAVAPAAAVAQNTVAPSSTYDTPPARPAPDHGYGTGTVSGNVSGNPVAGVPVTQDDLDAWTRDYSTRNHGRITRQAYLDEVGRRWDAMDRSHQGLTPAEVSHLTGRVDSNAPAPLTGNGVQPGNMGPGNSKGK
jgi:hypothetical protein